MGRDAHLAHSVRVRAGHLHQLQQGRRRGVRRGHDYVAREFQLLVQIHDFELPFVPDGVASSLGEGVGEREVGDADIQLEADVVMTQAGQQVIAGVQVAGEHETGLDVDAHGHSVGLGQFRLGVQTDVEQGEGVGRCDGVVHVLQGVPAGVHRAQVAGGGGDAVISEPFLAVEEGRRVERHEDVR